ncbi:MAG: protein kinase, partial [Sandaracinaceae bacterium]
MVRDRYRIEEKLGEGGMAEVYRAFDIASGRRVAVKVLHPEVAANPEAVERTRREGQVLSQLDNPAIVHVETFGELDDGTVFLVMELLEGETLGDRMRRGPLDPQELAPIVAGTCAGLFAAHAQQIIHRDLKPDNIYLCPTDTGVQVKLLDFGISKVFGGKRLTQTGEVLGTPRYMSPEQLGAEHDVDGRVDIYALGVILYEALAGKPPFLATTPTDLIIAILNGKVAPLRAARPDVPPSVEAVVMRAMNKVRAARFDTAMQLAEAYIDAVGGVAAVRKMQRRGMATRAFGGKVEVPIVVPGTNPPPATPEAEVSGKLKLGTFSGLPQMSAPIEPPPGKRRPIPETGSGTREMGSSGADAPVAPEPVVLTPPVDPAPAPRPMPATREMPIGMIPDTPVPEPPRPRVAETEMMDVSSAGITPPPPAPSVSRVPVVAPPKRPSTIGRVALVLGALLAGAASAGLVILVLMWTEAPADDTPAPATPSEVVPSPPAEPAATIDAGVASAPVEPLPEAEDPPPAPVVASAETPAARRRRSRRSTEERE